MKETVLLSRVEYARQRASMKTRLAGTGYGYVGQGVGRVVGGTDLSARSGNENPGVVPGFHAPPAEWVQLNRRLRRPAQKARPSRLTADSNRLEGSGTLVGGVSPGCGSRGFDTRS